MVIGFRRRKAAAREEKIGRVYCFGKRNVLRLDLKESDNSFFWTGRGRSLHVDGPKSENAGEQTVESLVRGNWILTRILSLPACRHHPNLPLDPFCL